MRKIELRPLSDPKPGYGQLVIIGGNVTGEGMSVDIQRNQDEHFLQDNGQWGSHPFTFQLPELQTDSEGNQTAIVDRQIVDPLLENPHATNMARFYGPDGAELGRARIKLARDLISFGARGSTPSLAASAAVKSPEPPPAPIPPEPVPEPTPVEPEPEPEIIPAVETEPPQQTEKGSRRWLWVALVTLLLLIILAAAAWFGLSMRDDEPVDSETAQEEIQQEEEASEPEPEEEAENETSIENNSPQPAEPNAGENTAALAAAPCSLQRMDEQGELEFIQGCTAAESETSSMIDVIDEALTNEHCGIARRLYAHEALNGDIEAALGYARQFDPEQHSPSACFPEPDAETAIFWYETAQGIDADNAEASQRLEVLQ
ncbi:hypothetical protein [Halomonas sp. QHL1]|uniref:hypothetical protein n=1 Tax=Halomonas sp. QHL1 TaxID=1123773 RepID=UPI0008FD80F8|nr:hypothetical protein [Halomonas sp. QHL1]OJA05822.1 hypothetical protein QHL1GM_10700 [Halomonas sp. QHL1]